MKEFKFTLLEHPPLYPTTHVRVITVKGENKYAAMNLARQMFGNEQLYDIKYEVNRK